MNKWADMWPAGCSLPIFGLEGIDTSRKTGKQTPSLTVVYTLPPPPPKMKAAPETNRTQWSESWALASLGKPIPVPTWGNPGQLPLLRVPSHTCKCSDTHTMASSSSDASCHLCTRPRWLNRVTEGSGGGRGSVKCFSFSAAREASGESNDFCCDKMSFRRWQ